MLNLVIMFVLLIVDVKNYKKWGLFNAIHMVNIKQKKSGNVLSKDNKLKKARQQVEASGVGFHLLKSQVKQSMVSPLLINLRVPKDYQSAYKTSCTVHTNTKTRIMDMLRGLKKKIWNMVQFHQN